MRYALIVQGQVARYPYTLPMLRRDHPDAALPDDFDLSDAGEYGVVPVADSAQPELAEGQTLDEALPIEANGQWFRNWIVHDWLEIAPGGLYARVTEGTVSFPYTARDVRLDFGISARAGAIRQMDGEWGVVPVEPVDMPPVAPGQLAANLPDADGIEEYAPGLWRQVWTVRNRTAPELAQAKADKLDQLRNLRWQKSVGGMTFNGMAIRTDDASQAKIAGLVALFEKAPGLATSDFEAQPNVWVTFDQATANALGVAVGLHVQACFSNQRTLAALIDAAGSFADLEEIDIAAGWPE